MATADQYAEWIIANQAKKGTPEFNTVAAAYQEAKAQEIPKRDMAAEVANDSITRGALEAQKPQGFAENLGTVMFGDPEKTPVPGIARDIQRQVRLTGRYGLEALPSGGAIADTLGLPTPQNATERVVGDIARTMAQGAGIAGLAGKLVPTLAGVPQRIASQFAINTPTTMAANAAGGAGAGMAREGGAGPMGQMGASLGAALAVPLVANAGSVAANYARNNIGSSKSFAGRLANEVAGDRRREILDLLKGKQTGPLGERLTAGEAASPAGRAEFSGLEKVVRPNQATGFDDIAQSQAQARANAIRGFGGTADSLESSIAKRGSNAAINYGDAYAQQIRANPELARLISNPYVKDEIGTALKLAEANGINPKDNLTEFLHYVKIGLDKQLSKTGNDSLSSTQQKAVADAKTQLVDWLSKANPRYETARSVFSAESKPINQMQVGQYLESKLTAPMAEQGAEVPQRAAAYAQALRDAPQTIKRSTGFPRYNDLGQVLTPEQVGVTQKVGQSLGRSAENERLGGLGAQKARELIAAIEPPLPSAGMLSPVYSVLRAITNRIHGSVTSKVTETLSKAMQDPKAMAALMESATPAERAALAPYLPTAPILSGARAMTQGQSQ